MNFKTSIRTFLALGALAFATFITPPPARAQLQSVDPTVGATCNVVTQSLMIAAQTGYFMCYPNALATNAGTWQRVNPGQNSVTYTINFNQSTLAAAAATTANVALVTLPAGTEMESVIIVNKAQFVGPSLTAATASVGDSSSNTAFSGTVNVFAAASATTLTVGGTAVQTTTAADAILVHFILTGANASVLTAGQVQVTLNYFLAPPGSITIASMLRHKYPAPGFFWVPTQERPAPDYPMSAASARRHDPMARLVLSKKQLALRS